LTANLAAQPAGAKRGLESNIIFKRVCIYKSVVALDESGIPAEKGLLTTMKYAAVFIGVSQQKLPTAE